MAKRTDSPEFAASRETVSGQVYDHARVKGRVPQWRPHLKTRRVLDQVREIFDLYRAQLPLTARQIFYVLVGRYGYPKTEKAYNNLLEHLKTARRAGWINWRDMRDDKLSTIHPSKRFTSERAFFDYIGRSWVDNFELNPTTGQDVAVELWTEAQGMTQQLDRVCDPLGVAVYSGSGFDSLTTVLETAERIVSRYEDTDRRTTIIRVGDFDPSGRSIIDAFAADVWAWLAEWDLDGDGYHHDLSDLLTVEVAAVTDDQIDEHNLTTVPQNPDEKRAGHMPRTVQAEALPPDVLARVVEDTILAHLDEGVLEAVRSSSGLYAARVADRFYEQRGQAFWAEFAAGRENGGTS